MRNDTLRLGQGMAKERLLIAGVRALPVWV
jgi:hypothetical protein